MRYADIARSGGTSTTEAANQAMATANVTFDGGSGTMGSANSNAPMQGSPAVIVVVLILAFAALRIFAARAGEAEHYEGIAPSFYNIMVISLAGMLGSILFKTAASKLPSNNALRAFVYAA